MGLALSLMRCPTVALCLVFWLLTSPAWGQRGDDRVDRLSGRFAASLLVKPRAEHFQALRPASVEDGRVLITAVAFGPTMGRGARSFFVRAAVQRPGDAARLLLVDAGALFVGPENADFVPVPNQRFVIDQPVQSIDIEVLPLWPERPLPIEKTPLQVVGTRDPGVLSLLRTVQHIEVEDVRRLARYLKEDRGQLEVVTPVENEDVRMARWMTWDRDFAGQIRGRIPRDGIRFALYAITGGYTSQSVADWLRSHRQLELDPAVDGAWRISRKVEYLLERSGLNYRVFSQRHGDYYFNLGVIAFQARRLEDAATAFQKAVELRSDDVEAQYNLGVTLYRLGQHKKAQTAFLVASGMHNATADIFFNQGATLYRNGDKLGAARAFRKALTLNPADEEAQTWLKKADPQGRTAPKRKRRRRRRRRRR